MTFDVQKCRADFPILSRKIHGKPMVYFDNAATLQKTQAVMTATENFYSDLNSNVHRSVHHLGQEATAAYESARSKIKSFVATQASDELILTKGATESLNLLASSLGDLLIDEGDQILVTRMEHHANFVPWQALAKRKKAQFQILELTSDYGLSLEALDKALEKKPKILAFSAMSNVTGYVSNSKEIIARAKQAGAVVVVDAAQWVAHRHFSQGCFDEADFVVLSAHKIGGPMGVGLLRGKRDLLEKMQPYQFGGEMISEVGDQETTWNELPFKFEAGTPNVGGAIGFAAAIDYLEKLGFENIEAYEKKLTEKLMAGLREIDLLELIGPKNLASRGPVFSFVLKSMHANDLGGFLDSLGIEIRVGHHCAQPLLAKFGYESSARVSLSFYNTEDEIEAFIDGTKKAVEFF